MAFYVTDELVAQVPGLATLDHDARRQVIGDAERVWRYVGQNQGISDDDLRAYGERNDLPPDRVNAAILLLTQLGKLYVTDVSPAVILPEPEPAAATTTKRGRRKT